MNKEHTTNVSIATIADSATSLPTQEDESYSLVKKIGKTTYKVAIHFNTSSNETMSDKIKRMLQNEVQQMSYFDFR